MPKWLTKIFSGGLGDSVEKIGGVIERISAGHLGKKEAMLAVEEILDRQHARAADEAVAIIGAKERILVAELQQGDSYTKRARPSVIYVGLGAMVLNNVLFPWIAVAAGKATLPDIQLPAEFWLAWGGVAATWSVGRTVERVKANGWAKKLASKITGGTPSMMED